MVMTAPPILRSAAAAPGLLLLGVLVVLLALPRQASAAPYSSSISLAKATAAATHPAAARRGVSSILDTAILIGSAVNGVEGGRTDESTTRDKRLEREEEQREMLRRAILLVEPYHSGDGSQATAGKSTNQTLVAPLVIRDVYPTSGPISGGTVVQVAAEADPLGPFAGRRLSCRFAAEDPLEDDGSNDALLSLEPTASWLVDATIRSPTIVECPAPLVHRPLVTQLSLVDATTGTVASISRPSVSTSFAYYDQPILLSLEPGRGPLRGGTMVSARISGDVNPRDGKEDVACRFGNAWVNGALIGAGVVE